VAADYDLVDQNVILHAVRIESIGERHASACRYKNKVPEGSRHSDRWTHFGRAEYSFPSSFRQSICFRRPFAMSQPFGSNPDSNNPFSPSQQFQETPRPASKPTMATVFGILNLVFGGMSLLGQGFGLIMLLFLRKNIEEISKQPIPMPGPLQWVGTGIQILLTCWLIYSGIRVLRGTMSGRGAFLAYCIGSLLIRPFIVAINLFAQQEQIQQQMAAGGAQLPPAAVTGIIIGAGLFALVIAEIYEVVGFFVMRSKSVTQQFQAWDEVVNGQRSNQTFNFN
jgi:hypothetical protein